ncbi:unnamed protein product [Amoebophrya sp. A25]|nr:unnamed protein product [Amoebophrya sp. A25]|eukprot:GSA25T00005430001.1
MQRKRSTLADAVEGGSTNDGQYLPTPLPLSSRGYSVVARVSSSTSNVITKVREVASGNMFVCKSISLQNLQTVKAKLAAQQEVAILKALRHPNVIGYRNSFVVEESETSSMMGAQLVIIMEYATDGDLREKR